MYVASYVCLTTVATKYSSKIIPNKIIAYTRKESLTQEKQMYVLSESICQLHALGMCYIEPLCSLIGSYKPHTDVLVKMSWALMVSLSLMVLNSRDRHGIFGFLCMKNLPYNNVSFKYWMFIH